MFLAIYKLLLKSLFVYLKNWVLKQWWNGFKRKRLIKAFRSIWKIYCFSMLLISDERFSFLKVLNHTLKHCIMLNVVIYFNSVVVEHRMLLFPLVILSLFRKFAASLFDWSLRFFVKCEAIFARQRLNQNRLQRLHSIPFLYSLTKVYSLLLCIKQKSIQLFFVYAQAVMHPLTNNNIFA